MCVIGDSPGSFLHGILAHRNVGKGFYSVAANIVIGKRFLEIKRTGHLKLDVLALGFIQAGQVAGNLLGDFQIAQLGVDIVCLHIKRLACRNIKLYRLEVFLFRYCCACGFNHIVHMKGITRYIAVKLCHAIVAGTKPDASVQQGIQRIGAEVVPRIVKLFFQLKGNAVIKQRSLRVVDVQAICQPSLLGTADFIKTSYILDQLDAAAALLTRLILIGKMHGHCAVLSHSKIICIAAILGFAAFDLGHSGRSIISGNTESAGFLHIVIAGRHDDTRFQLGKRNVFSVQGICPIGFRINGERNIFSEFAFLVGVQTYHRLVALDHALSRIGIANGNGGRRMVLDGNRGGCAVGVVLAAVHGYFCGNANAENGGIRLRHRVGAGIAQKQSVQLLGKLCIIAGGNDRTTLGDGKRRFLLDVIRQVVGGVKAIFTEHLVHRDLILILRVGIGKRASGGLAHLYLNFYLFARRICRHGIAGDGRSRFLNGIFAHRQLADRVLSGQNIGIGQSCDLLLRGVIYLKLDGLLLFRSQIIAAQIAGDGLVDLQRTVRRIGIFDRYGLVACGQGSFALTGNGKRIVGNTGGVMDLFHFIGSLRHLAQGIDTVGHLRVRKRSRGSTVGEGHLKFGIGRNICTGCGLLDLQVCRLLDIGIFKRGRSSPVLCDLSLGRGRILRTAVYLVCPGVAGNVVLLGNRVFAYLKARQYLLAIGKIRVLDGLIISVGACYRKRNVVFYAARNSCRAVPVGAVDGLVQLEASVVGFIIILQRKRQHAAGSKRTFFGYNGIRSIKAVIGEVRMARFHHRVTAGSHSIISDMAFLHVGIGECFDSFTVGIADFKGHVAFLRVGHGNIGLQAGNILINGNGAGVIHLDHDI